MKNKSNKGLMVLVVILIILVLGLSAYIFCDKKLNLFSNDEVHNSGDKIEQGNNTSSVDAKYSLPQRKTVLLISGAKKTQENVNKLNCGTVLSSPLSIIVDTKGDAYLIIDCMVGTNASNYQLHKEETNSFINALEEKNNIKFSKYTIDVYSDVHGETMAYKLPISNVSMAYNTYFMTGGGNYFVFVLNDGKVVGMTNSEILSSGTIKIKTFSDLNNILYVVDSGLNKANSGVFAVTNNGDEIFLDSYFYDWFQEYRESF